MADDGVVKRAVVMVRWLKKNPIITAIGIAASILGFIKGIPAAWNASMDIAGRPKCFSHSDTYNYSGGAYRKQADNWIEDDGVNRYRFIEARRDKEYVYLRNTTPRSGDRRVMLVRLPACGGSAQWTYQNPMQWIDMYPVWRQ